MASAAWPIGLVLALAMIGLAEFAGAPDAARTPETPVSPNAAPAAPVLPISPIPSRDFRAALRDVKTVPAHLRDDKTEPQVIYAKRVAGAAEPHAGPMALLSQMEGVKVKYLNQFDVTMIKIPPDWDAQWLMEIIDEDTSVDYMEKPDYKIIPHAAPTTPNDPYFPQQTNLHDAINDVDIDAPEAWAYTTGSTSSDSIVVVVHDIGFTIHPNFERNLWVNDKEIAGDGIDNDDNGCIDDIHGCNLFTGTGTFNSPLYSSHGTEVATVLGARGNDHQGITGVAWAVRMMLMRSGTIVERTNYILNLRDNGVDIRVINFSAGYGPCVNESPRSISTIAFRRLESAGILFVQSAGNIGSDIDEQDGEYPRCLGLSNHVQVASHNRDSFSLDRDSNYGQATVDLAAPGQAVPIGVSEDGLSVSRKSGTSFAAPHVSGAAALLWNYRPDLTMTEVRSILLDTVRRVPALSGRVASGGALNVGNAIYAVTTPGIVLHTSRTTVIEGGRGYVDVSLVRVPSWRTTRGVVVLRAGVADGAGVVFPSSLTFTFSNWRSPQRVFFDTRDELGTRDNYVAEMGIMVDALRTTTESRSLLPVTVTFTVTNVGVSSATVSSLSGDVSEDEDEVSFRIRLRGIAGTPSAPVRAAYHLSGTARGGVAGDLVRDYTWPAGYDAEAGVGTATVTNGDTMAVALPLHDDVVNESREEVSLELLRVVAGGAKGVLSSGSRATVRINDNDPLTVSVAVPSNENALRVGVRVLLQGAYDPVRGGMRTELIEHLPTTQPYMVAPWRHVSATTVAGVSGGFGLSPVTATVVDWVLVELRQVAAGSGTAAAASTGAVAREAALLLSDGAVAGVRADAASAASAIDAGGVTFRGVAIADVLRGDWYVVVHHRNHLPVMSATRLVRGDSCAADYCVDFRGAQSHGDGQVEVAVGVYALVAGDTDRDGVIDERDEALIRVHNLTVLDAAHYRDADAAGNYAVDADLDFDGEVLSGDRYFVIENHDRRRMITVP